MINISVKRIFFFTSTLFFSHVALAQSRAEQQVLNAKYDFNGEHSRAPQQFIMKSKLMQIGPDGKKKDSTIYTLRLSCLPGKNVTDGDEYTCERFTIRTNNGPEVSIPALTNWEYAFKKSDNNKDEKGQVFGIDHAKFENITDSNGQKLMTEKLYHTYNAFIDFHALLFFAEKTTRGKGVQDLHYIGDKVIHSSAFSEPPVNLGSQIKEGSVFRNGEITLAFKGLGRINKKSCAILGYDSGESSFTMNMYIMPPGDVITNGSSHYWGDIYKDLQSGWLQLATLNELVVSETEIKANSSKVHSVIERAIEIRNISGHK